jgi:hypothetical protein
MMLGLNADGILVETNVQVSRLVILCVVSDIIAPASISLDRNVCMARTCSNMSQCNGT